MAEERAQRRLAAILAADVVSYSRLMGVSEVGNAGCAEGATQGVLDALVAKDRGHTA